MSRIVSPVFVHTLKAHTRSITLRK